MRPQPTSRQNAATVSTAVGSAPGCGVSNATLPANKSARAAASPACSDPAIGWLPTKRLKSGANASTTGFFTLPTSVTSACGSTKGATCCANPGITPIGTHKITTSAPRTTLARSVEARSQNAHASDAASSRRAQTVTRHCGARARSANAREPPSKPGPRMATWFTAPTASSPPRTGL